MTTRLHGHKIFILVNLSHSCGSILTSLQQYFVSKTMYFTILISWKICISNVLTSLLLIFQSSRILRSYDSTILRSDFTGSIQPPLSDPRVSWFQHPWFKTLILNRWLTYDYNFILYASSILAICITFLIMGYNGLQWITDVVTFYWTTISKSFAERL